MRVQPVEVWHDCGKPDTLLETNRYLLDHGRDNSAIAAQRPGVVVVPPVYIDPTAVVTEAVIGPHVSHRRRLRGARVRSCRTRSSTTVR